MIATAISLYYYLGVIRALYLRPAAELRPAIAGGSPPRDPLLQSAVFLALVVTVGSFFFVQPLIDLASDAAASLPFCAVPPPDCTLLLGAEGGAEAVGDGDVALTQRLHGEDRERRDHGHDADRRRRPVGEERCANGGPEQDERERQRREQRDAAVVRLGGGAVERRRRAPDEGGEQRRPGTAATRK